MHDWPELLDALEERTRRLSDALAAGQAFDVPERDLPEPDLTAVGQLPPELALRVRVLLAETERLQACVERRRGPQARAAAAYRSH